MQSKSKNNWMQYFSASSYSIFPQKQKAYCYSPKGERFTLTDFVTTH